MKFAKIPVLIIVLFALASENVFSNGSKNDIDVLFSLSDEKSTGGKDKCSDVNHEEDETKQEKYYKLTSRIFEDSKFLSTKDLAKLKRIGNASSRYFNCASELYNNALFFAKTSKLMKKLVKDKNYVGAERLVQSAWFFFDKKAVVAFDSLLKELSKETPSFKPFIAEKWKNLYRQVVLEKSLMMDIASRIKPENKVERILLDLIINSTPSDYFAKLPAYFGFFDKENAVFVENPNQVENYKIFSNKKYQYTELQVRQGRYLLWNALHLTLEDNKNRKIQFKINPDFHSSSDMELIQANVLVKVLKPASTCEKLICFQYQLDTKETKALWKGLRNITKTLFDKYSRISEKIEKEKKDKECQEFHEKDDISASKKPRDAFPVTWAQKRKIEDLMKAVDLDGLKKYVKDKNVNFNYIHKFHTSLYPVIEATKRDKDPERFKQFLNFMLNHGFDLLVFNPKSKVNALLETVNAANYHAFKELMNRGVKYKLKFYREKLNILQCAKSILNHYNKISPDYRKHFPEVVKQQERAAKTLKTQIIPYLKSLKDPKTGEPLFKD